MTKYVPNYQIWGMYEQYRNEHDLVKHVVGSESKDFW
jgi:hypothetical protein